jgi:hypothetical protein
MPMHHKLCALIAFAIVFSPMASKAVVGIIDTEDQFPFVVKLDAEASDGTRWSCSGAVSITGLVSTAGHCVWDPEHGRAKRIKITYKDADGNIHVVPDYKIFYEKEFEVAYSRWFNSKNVAPPDVVSLNFNLMSVQDIAFIVPADNIEVEGFPHWATELLDVSSCGTTTLDTTTDIPPQRCWGKYSDAKIRDELGNLSGLRAMAVGYGYYYCDTYDERKQTPNSCKIDNQRRYAEVPLIQGVEARGRTFSPPELWCTGKNELGISPVQHGDSGGPRFIRAKDGRWIFIGYTSGGNNNEGCASSIFMHLDLWREAATFKSRIKYHNNFPGAENWTSHQLQRFLSEYLESWSAPRYETIPRQKSFFNNFMNSYIESAGYKSIIDFAQRWPKRSFKLSPGIEPEVVVGDDGDSQIKAVVDWTVEDPATGAAANGTVSIDAFVRMGWPTETQYAYGIADIGPYFSSWKCLIQNGGNEVGGWDCHKPSIAHWTHNGSTVRLSASGTKREFYYVAPRQGLLDRGVKPGSLVFSGRRHDNTYTGIAYIFTQHCGPVAYSVAGEVGLDDRSVTMRGQAPRVDGNCRVTSTRDDTLVFVFSEDE